LNQPVASPSTCPSNVNGTTIGRSSPWVGTVDVSVFLRPNVTTQQVLKIANDLRTDPLVQTVYFESARQAYQEFERLYTCWTAVPRSQTPASYRLVLVPNATLATRDLLVRRLAKQPAVDTVSCDPTVPCVNVLPSASRSP
jgi:cell division protein FtsX